MHSIGGKDISVSSAPSLAGCHAMLRSGADEVAFLDLFQAAMDTGTAIATIIIFFALGYHAITFNWWGNTVGSNTDDANSVPWLSVPSQGYFGKGPGQF